MKKKLALFALLFPFTCSLAQLEGTWIVSPQPYSLGVGPAQGNMSYWHNTYYDLNARTCFFDDTYAFNEDGSFNNILGNETWLEEFQGPDTASCGAPVAPHDGSNPATWSYDPMVSTLTLEGTGAYLGLPKVINGGQLTSPNQAPPSITYIVTYLDPYYMVLDIDIGDGWWRFSFEKLPEAVANANLIDLQIDGSTIPGFIPYLTYYLHALPEGTVFIPQITSATPLNPEASVVEIIQAQSIPGDAYVEVLAADSTTTNIYIVSIDIAIPNTAPPEPVHAQEDVISIYSDAYINLPGTDFTPWFWIPTIITVDELIAGNNTLKYENLDYAGIQYTNLDVSGYEYLHLDFWRYGNNALYFYLISPGPIETPYLLPFISGAWTGVDIPLSYFVPPVNLNDVYQFKIYGDPESSTVWIDNIFFWKSMGTGIETRVVPSLNISPNPATGGIITVNMGEYHYHDHLFFFDIYGQKVHRQEITGSETVIDVSTWAPGIYLAVVYKDGRPVGRSKFVVSR